MANNYRLGHLGRMKLVLGLVLLLVVMVLLSPRKASALILNPDPGSAGAQIGALDEEIPDVIYGIVKNCELTATPGASTTYPVWGSIAFQPWSTVTAAAYGQASIDLDLNIAMTSCLNANGVPPDNTSNTWVLAITDFFLGASVTTPAGPGGSVNIHPSMGRNYAGANVGIPGQFQGAYNRGTLELQLNPPGGFTQTGWYSATLTTTSIVALYDANTGNISFFCGGTGIIMPRASLTDNYASCPPVFVTVWIFVTVPDQPPAGALLSVDCQNNWIGWAADRDNVGWGIRVHFYLDGPAGAGVSVGYATANLPNGAANAAGYPGNHGFSFPAPPGYKWGAHTVYAYAVGIDAAGNENGEVQLASSPQAFAACIPPTPTVVCRPNAAGAITFNQPEYGVAGTMTTGITNNTPGGSPPNITITSVTYSPGPTLIGGSTFTPNPVASVGGTSDITQNATFPAPNTYVVTATINYQATLANGALFSGTLICSGTINVYAKPYVKAYGADIYAGGGFGAACNANAGVYGFAKSAAGIYTGASGQFGITALLNINEFYSASNRSTNNKPAKGLSISNTAGNPTYGGAYGNECLSITDYFSDPTQVPPPPGGGTRDPDPSVTAAVWVGPPNQPNRGKLRFTDGNGASTTTIGGFTIKHGTQYVLYVNGDAYINGNIDYQANPPARKDIPYFALIARGNIYIAPNVTNIDGLYVAQPLANGTKGKIYTCAQINGPFPAATVYTNCKNNRLTVNGALVAQQVKFLRTIETLNSSFTPETPTNSKAAEIINFTPELYMADTPLRNPDATPGTKTYDAVFSLPPVF